MWSWQIFWEVMPLLLAGFRVTVQITLASFVVALVGGLVLTLLRRSQNAFVSRSASTFVEFVRSTPLLVQLYFLYYVLPSVGLTLPAIMLGIIGLGAHYSTYVSEVYRAGIDAVPRGQWEAAKALNLPTFRVWFAIIIPQALPPILPVLGNRFVALFKETPLLVAITVSEMLLAAREFGSERFSYLEPYTGVGLLFFAASLISSVFVGYLEKQFGKPHA